MGDEPGACCSVVDPASVADAAFGPYLAACPARAICCEEGTEACLRVAGPYRFRVLLLCGPKQWWKRCDHVRWVAIGRLRWRTWVAHLPCFAVPAVARRLCVCGSLQTCSSTVARTAANRPWMQHRWRACPCTTHVKKGQAAPFLHTAQPTASPWMARWVGVAAVWYLVGMC